jgi:hypothetical protein
MSGILANSSAKTMTDGDTSEDNSVAGYVLSEQIVLTTSPTGAVYSWGLSKPSGATSRSDLNDSASDAPTFTPDVAGYYVVTVNVDISTSYVIRIAAVAVAVTTPREAIRFTPLEDTQVTAPPLGCCLYFSSTQNALAVKFPDDSVATVNTTAV